MASEIDRRTADGGRFFSFPDPIPRANGAAPMTDRERVKLLSGPYTPPRLKRGDRATCLVRDCTVVITGMSAGRIPWPRCRALDQRGGGGSGLLVDETLALAVRQESAVAVMHWWGVSAKVVWR